MVVIIHVVGPIGTRVGLSGIVLEDIFETAATLEL